MQVSYTLADEDYRALARFLFHETPRGRETVKRNKVSAVILAASATAIAFAFFKDIIPAVLLGALVFVIVRTLGQSTARKRLLRIYNTIRPPDERRMQEPGTLTLTPEGIEARYGKGSGKVAWQAVTQVGRDSSHVFIILGKVNAFVVPLRDFATSEDFEAFYRTAVDYRAKAVTQAAEQRQS